ncbi:hypothetical protein H920_15888 [Fukomys damarensis]|uniref:Uncharacterized protein n=1 Tax=Fukomys damarensis TaxID=885580 RepID=A0A091CTJ6_FUKDA|nr:hypothetical protein H920_15888 [Fukomys damarensis]
MAGLMQEETRTILLCLREELVTMKKNGNGRQAVNGETVPSGKKEAEVLAGEKEVLALKEALAPKGRNSGLKPMGRLRPMNLEEKNYPQSRKRESWNHCQTHGEE